MPSKTKRAAKKKSPAKKAKKSPKTKRAASRARPTPTKRAAPNRGRETTTRGVPDSIRRLAERTVAKPRTDAAEVWDTGSSELKIRDQLAEASAPGVVVESRLEAAVALPDVSIDEPPPLRASPETPAVAHVGSAHTPGGQAIIDVDDLHVFYGAVEALKGISFKVYEGETVSIIGSNGAGKTTTLKTVSGVSELLKHVRGHITIMGERVESWPAHKIARLGVAHSPEGRKIFPNQTVRDNLMLGAFGRKDSEIDQDIEEQYARFPILGQRHNQAAGLMSGGEQQMLAMARALMARPKVILFDEPSMGLAPLIVKQIFEIISSLKAEGKTILLVEQMAFQALGIADRGYVLETGTITMEGSGGDLLADPRVKEAYLGA